MKLNASALFLCFTLTAAWLLLAKCTELTDIPASEKVALQRFFNSTGGISGSWINAIGWNGTGCPNNACCWIGVSCSNDSTPRVVGLQLSSNGLQGAIPELPELFLLEELDLDSNNITGTIPSFVNLTNLQYLDLSSNFLTGTIPSFANLPNLQHLDLDANLLSGTIPCFSNLTNLVFLWLYDNKLSGTIPSFPELSSLQTLALGNNLLSGTMPSFANLRDLQLLSFYSNRLTGTIPSYSHLLNLQNFSMYDNQLTGIIPSFSNLFSMLQLALNTNQLTGTIPSFSTLTNLQLLFLQNNPLSGTIPSSFANLTKMQNLDLSTAQLTGTVPSFIKLTNLKQLYLSANQLSGTIPSFATLTNLKLLGLYSNRLSGTIPTFASLTNLQLLFLYSNQLTGTIPSFANLIQLTELYLMSNLLTGTIPSFETLVNLTQLTLHDNRLSGIIPSFAHPGLQIVFLSQNPLTGTIPSSFANLTNLQILSLASNQLSGTIPSFSNCTSLTQLNLADNQLTGTIPSFSTLVNLTQLDLHSNKLTGTIPSFATLVNLEQLTLQSNQLTGTIPSLANFANLQLLYLYENYLNGSIPSFEDLINLQQMDLHRNQLTETVPDFSPLQNLQQLNLAFNNLTSLPPAWAPLWQGSFDGLPVLLPGSQLSSLAYISLSGNRFNSSVNSALQSLFMMPSLVVVDLSFNSWSDALDNTGFGYYGLNGKTLRLQIQGWPSLVSLNISASNISGSLPSILPPLLSIFNLRDNQLSGTIPNTYGTLSVLNVINNRLFSPEKELPSFLSFDADHPSVHPQQHHSCAIVVGASQLFNIDDSYTNYSHCTCDSGYAGCNGVCNPCAAGSRSIIDHDSSDNSTCTRCEPCPQGTYSSNASAVCLQCGVQAYSFRPGSTSCFPCPAEGISCINGIPVALANYWMYIGNSTTGEVTAVLCLSGYCIGGSDLNAQCASGRVQSSSNILCGGCELGTSEWNGQCISCDDVNALVVLLIVVLSVGYVVFVHQLSQSPKSGLTSIFFYFVQTGLTICGGIGSLVSWLGIFSASAQTAFSLCPGPLNAYSKILLDLLIPAVFFITLFVFFGLRLLYERMCIPFWFEFGKTKDRYLRSACSLYLFGLSQISVESFEYLYCIDVGGSKVMYFNPSVHCDDLTYLRWKPAVIVYLVVNIALVPLGLVCYFLWHRVEFQAALSALSALPSDKNLSCEGFSYRWGVLFEAFEPRAFYYQLIIIFRRLLVVIMTVYLASSAQSVLLMGFSLLHVMAGYLHLHLIPFRLTQDNHAESITLLLLAILSIVLREYPPASNEVMAAVILLFLIPSLVLVTLLCISLTKRCACQCVQRPHHFHSMRSPLPSTLKQQALRDSESPWSSLLHGEDHSNPSLNLN